MFNDRVVFSISYVLEGFFYGLYSGIFIMYLQYHASKKDMNRTQNIIFYSICALYVLSVVVFICDITSATYQLYQLFGKSQSSLILHVYFVDNTSFACCDFIAQFILIYRCWIVWGRNIRVVIIPSILTFAFLGTWLASGNSTYILSDHLIDPGWKTPVILSGLILSLTVNALVTGLIVFRIFKVFREVKVTLDDQMLGVNGGSKLRRIIFILIESGMALFSIQLARLLLTNVWTDAAYGAFDIVAGIHAILTGITPTIIVVRTAMGLSFDDERSMEEVAIESLCFASNHPDPVLETESVGIVGEDRRDLDDDDIGIQGSNDIDVVER